jgi:chaperonin cofactor prefoldin
MRKNTRATPRNTESYSTEINTDNYPFYRFIPVAHIEEKQCRIMDRYRPVKQANVHIYSEPPLPVYTEPLPQNLPILDLVPTGKPNTYEVDFKNLEDKVLKMQNEIDSNSYTITQQEEHIDENYKTLAQQAHQLHSNTTTIQNNGAYIQQQIHCYTHNTSIINHQCSIVQQQNTEIATKQEQIENLNTEIASVEDKLRSLQEQIESYQGQLNYHASMLTAFNTLIQNPQYFSQLMMTAMGQESMWTQVTSEQETL